MPIGYIYLCNYVPGSDRYYYNKRTQQSGEHPPLENNLKTTKKKSYEIKYKKCKIASNEWEVKETAGMVIKPNSRNVHDLIKEEMDLNAEHTSNTDFCAFSDDAKWH